MYKNQKVWEYFFGQYQSASEYQSSLTEPQSQCQKGPVYELQRVPWPKSEQVPQCQWGPQLVSTRARVPASSTPSVTASTTIPEYVTADTIVPQRLALAWSLNSLVLVEWVKWVFRRFADNTYSWFFISGAVKKQFWFFSEFSLIIWSYFS